MIYTDIFNEYTVEIEKYIEAALVQVGLREIWQFLQISIIAENPQLPHGHIS